jgi:glucose-1-phosphate adenylyltransferase
LLQSFCVDKLHVINPCKGRFTDHFADKIDNFFRGFFAVVPEYSFFEPDSPIYTHPRFLPGSKINGATLRQAIISDGCIISDAHLERCVVGIRSVIQSGATIRDSIVMGADYFELGQTDSLQPPIGIGRNCVIDRAIIDKNARIADGVVITPEGKPPNFDADNYFIRDGIVVIPKNAVVPAGFWI